VPAGPISLLAHGPTHEYRVQPARSWGLAERDAAPAGWGWREPLPGERYYYTHAQTELELTTAEPPLEVRLRLVRGESVVGRVLGPNGELVQSAVLLCGEKVSPLRSGSVLPLPVRGGRYELPGCTAGRTYPVLFLDAVNGWGTAVDLTSGCGAGPEVRLARCGSARVRIVDGMGRPRAGRHVGLWLLTERSFPTGPPPREREADGHFASWYDPVHYAHTPPSDADGWLTLPALIPGARYHLRDLQTNQHYLAFTVREGEHKQLPDIVLGALRMDVRDGD
jgi:hypothetical protein